MIPDKQVLETSDVLKFSFLLMAWAKPSSEGPAIKDREMKCVKVDTELQRLALMRRPRTARQSKVQRSGRNRLCHNDRWALSPQEPTQGSGVVHVLAGTFSNLLIDAVGVAHGGEDLGSLVDVAPFFNNKIFRPTRLNRGM